MNKYILKNARIINPFTSTPLIEKGYVAVSDQLIAGVGSGEPPVLSDFEIVDLSGKTLLPGMINAHTHLYSALALGMPAPGQTPTNFTEKLEQVWWKLDRALDEDSTRSSFEAGLLDCLQNGVTTVIDHHSSQNFVNGSLAMLAEIAKSLDMNVALAFEISDRNGSDVFEASLLENINSLKNYTGDGTIKPLIGLHASFTLSDQSLEVLANKLNDIPDWGIHIHVAEDKADHEDALRRGYNSVIQRLDKFGLINQNSLVIHGIYMIPEDVDLLAEKGAALVHNPTSNANNRVGMLSPDIISRMKAGLGTDGMQANMLREAKEGMLIRSSHLPGGAGNVDYFELLFKNNPLIATKLFNSQLGHMSVGSRADIAIYDYQPRTAVTADNIGGHLLFGLGSPVSVIAGGKFKLRDSKWVGVDARMITDKARFQSERLWNAMKQIN